MKKFCTLLLTSIFILSVLICSGCNLTSEVTERKNVYKKYVSMPAVSDGSYDGAYTDYIANYKAGAVVSVISMYRYQVKSGGYEEVQTEYSGLLLNDDGYILSSSEATRTSTPQNARDTSEYLTPREVYIKLNPVYKDDGTYRAKIIDTEGELGLGILKLVDQFYYFTDASNQSSQKGFQFTAEFFDARGSMKKGDYCAFVGETLGDGVGITSGIICNDQMAILGLPEDSEEFARILYKDNEYRYIQASAALNAVGFGGALYDRNGYVTGVFVSKVYGNQGIVFSKTSLALPAACVTSYIDDVADRLKTVIEYTMAEAAV